MMPDDVEMPYTFLSSEPTYNIEPSTLSAGEDRTLPDVARVHSTVPAGENAYTLRSSFPTNTFPVALTTADD
jgi:hypothetical protein